MRRRTSVGLIAMLLAGCGGSPTPSSPAPTIGSGPPGALPPAEDWSHCSIGIPVPEEARFRLEVDKPEWILGETCILQFCLVNEGKLPFEFDFGGDYRSATRALRFKVAAVHEDGTEAKDPDSTQFCEGGKGLRGPLKPEESWYQGLSLCRYRTIDKPGTWTIRVNHDFGWVEKPGRSLPVAEVKLNFRAPSATEAAQLLEKALAGPGPEDAFIVYGQKSPPYFDPLALATPTYMPLLEGKKRSGDAKAARALDAIEQLRKASNQ